MLFYMSCKKQVEYPLSPKRDWATQCSYFEHVVFVAEHFEELPVASPKMLEILVDSLPIHYFYFGGTKPLAN